MTRRAFSALRIIRVKGQIACRDGEERSAVLQQYFKEQRRGKSCRNRLADKRKIISQKSRYLFLLKSDLGENRPRWRLLLIVSDSESERSRKIFLAEIEWRQGWAHDAPFSRIVRWIDVFRVNAKFAKILKKCSLLRAFLILGGPAGGSEP